MSKRDFITATSSIAAAVVIATACFWTHAPQAEEPSMPASSDAATAISVANNEDGTSSVVKPKTQSEREQADVDICSKDGAKYAEHSLIVVAHKSASEQEVLAELEQAGATGAHLSTLSNTLSSSETIFSAEYTSNVEPTVIAAALEGDGTVVSAEPNYILEPCDIEEGEDAAEAQQDQEANTTATALQPEATTINDTYASQEWQLDSIKAYDAWDSARTDGAVTVAVIDTGVDYDHEDLADNLILDYAKNTYTEETGGTAVDDVIGHGTHVTGIVASAANNGKGTAGVSYNAKVLPVKVTCNEKGEMLETDVIEALDYIVSLKTNSSSADCLKNIRVINMSIGGDSLDYMSAFQTAINGAYNAGILVVAAAGNSSTDKANYPSAFDNVVSVSALKAGSNGVGEFDSSYSNWHETVDICAPGTSICSTTKGNGYGHMTGTSMASPVVAGAAAVLFSIDADATPADVEAALEASAVDLGEEGHDDYYGYGALDLDAAVSYVENSIREHSFSAPSIVFSEDATSATATWMCATCQIKKTAACAVTSATAKPASCTEVGETTYTATAQADDKWGLSAGTASITLADIPALGHAAVTDAAVAPTCTVDGLTEGSHCSRCGKVLVAQEVAPATGHSGSDAVVENEVASTCTEDGVFDRVVYCKTCGTELSRETVIAPALGHAVVTDAAAAPTYAAIGFTEGSHCSRCGEILVAQESIPQLVKLVQSRAKVKTSKVKARGLKKGKLKKTKAFSIKVRGVAENAARTLSLKRVPKAAKGLVRVSKKGKLLVKKGLKKGRYTITVRVRLGETASYRAATLLKKVKVVVR